MDRNTEQRLHRALYLGIQRLRGRPIGPYIKVLQRWESLDRREFERLMQQRLNQALLYAHENVPLYATSPWRDALAHDATKLSAWPILQRSTVRSAARELHARRRISGVFYRRSSASTGEPVSIAWDPAGSAWGWANEYRAMLWFGVPPGTRTLLMWGSGPRIDVWVKNHRLFRTTELTPARLKEAAEYLISERPGLCQGLPSALTRLARYVRTHYPDAPSSLTSYVKVGGEQVYRFQRETVERALGARVVETYGCTEVGPIAAECPAGSMHILSENVHVEICRDDEPVPPGEHGDVIVTSLSNRAMPLVRCKIGDRGAIGAEPCECGRPQPVLQSLVGRASDVFLAADGRAVHGSELGWTFGSVLADAPPEAIQQTLFMQLAPRRWKVLVESDSGFDEAVAARLAAHVRAKFGNECDVEVQRVDVIPREPSGKFRYYRVTREDARTEGPEVEPIAASPIASRDERKRRAQA